MTDAERATLSAIVKKLKDSSQKVRHTQILLKADADGNLTLHSAHGLGCVECFMLRIRLTDSQCSELQALRRTDLPTVARDRLEMLFLSDAGWSPA